MAAQTGQPSGNQFWPDKQVHGFAIEDRDLPEVLVGDVEVAERHCDVELAAGDLRHRVLRFPIARYFEVEIVLFRLFA